jgi:NAD(P)-dependent dehydrogenase (short-subunit alcohol dehydrogenase family)
MDRQLEGKTVVITGASSGQGRAGAIEFAREGAQVALCDRDAAGLAETVSLVTHHQPNARVLAQPMDLRSLDDIRNAVAATLEEFNGIDVIYNNAGITHIASIAQSTEEDWDSVHAVNLKAMYFLVRAALPALKQSTSASVINVASGAGLVAPVDGNTLYCSSKGGVIALTRAMARELGPFGIRVNCLLPGPIETPLVARFFDESPDQLEVALSRTMQKRLGKPEEVAVVAVFLATSEASYLTGTTIPVDSGFLAV